MTALDRAIKRTVACPHCVAGRTTIRVTQLRDGERLDDFVRRTGRPIEITCTTCNGAGRLSRVKANALAAFNAAWCRCGNKSENVTYHPDGERGAACHKHHWTCDDCGKVVQVG